MVAVVESTVLHTRMRLEQQGFRGHSPFERRSATAKIGEGQRTEHGNARSGDDPRPARDGRKGNKTDVSISAEKIICRERARAMNSARSVGIPLSSSRQADLLAEQWLILCCKMEI